MANERQRLLAVTILAGGVCGLAAVAFHLTIAWLENLMINRANFAPGHSWIFWTILSPAIGGLIVGLVQAFLVGYHPSIGSIELTPDLLYPVMLVILLGVLRWLDQPRPPTPYVGSVALPTLLLVGGLLLGAALGLAGVWLVGRGARRRRAQAVQELRGAVAEVAWRNVVSPVEGVLGDHRTAREALAGAF